MRYYRFKYVERILIRESRTPFHRPPLKYLKCIVSLCSGYFESIEKPFLQYALCKSEVGMYCGGRGGGVLKGSNMLISPAHAFCLDYAQQAQVVDPSIGPSHPVSRRKWFQGSSSPLLLHKPNSHISLSPSTRPASPEYCVNFGRKISIFYWGNVGLRVYIMQMVPT